jgi:hypothetical protein
LKTVDSRQVPPPEEELHQESSIFVVILMTAQFDCAESKTEWGWSGLNLDSGFRIGTESCPEPIQNHQL